MGAIKFKTYSLLLLNLVLINSCGYTNSEHTMHEAGKDFVKSDPLAIKDTIDDQYEVESFVIVVDEGMTIKLTQERKKDVSVFEPIYRDHRISFNDEFTIALTDLESKSELYSPAYCFFQNNATVIKNDSKECKIRILLGQSGCSGEFCNEFVAVELTYNKTTHDCPFKLYDIVN